MSDNNKNDQQFSSSRSDKLPLTFSFEQDDKIDKASILEKSETDARTQKGSKSMSAVTETSSRKYDLYYNMNHKYRGKAYIFNHKSFDLPFPTRTGTDSDRKKLTVVLKNLGFDVTSYEDLTYSQINENIGLLARIDHDDSDCVLIAIMTHADKEGLLLAKDERYPIELLWSPFTADLCPSLAGKPKIFFIQACQDDISEIGVMLVKKREKKTDGGSSGNFYRIPAHADFMIVRSTVPGHYSWNEPGYGSWFIQTLSQELEDYGKELDLLRLLTFVNQKVAMFQTDLSRNRQKQIPNIHSMLTRLLVFGTKTQSDDADVLRGGELGKPKTNKIKLKPSLLSRCHLL